MSDRLRIAVVGSVNMDICGRPNAAFALRDSNPGQVTTSLGGVGANIARNLRLLGAEVRLVTALGGDAHAAQAMETLEREGLDLSLAVHAPEERTSTYLYITDEAGDMLAAVSDMKIQERLDPAFLETRLEALNASDAVVLDANLSQEALAFLTEKLTVPILADAVSAAKVGKLRDVLPRLSILKLNRIETEKLTGRSAASAGELMNAGMALLDLGLPRVCITLGERGALYMDTRREVIYPCIPPERIVGTNGAGDAFMAALTYCAFSGESWPEAVQAGLAAGSISLEAAEAVNPALSLETLMARREA